MTDFGVLIMAEKKQDEPGGSIAQNRKARFNYIILEKFEAGISLMGTEVKSCRERNVDLSAAFARIDKNQIILCELHIKPYECGHQFNHEPRRERRLLLHRREIDKLYGKITIKGRTLIPLSMYFNRRGIIKVELAVCQGKHLSDKRETLRRAETDKETRREIVRSRKR